jgi:peroxiredoxin
VAAYFQQNDDINFTMVITKGEQAPAFTLFDTNKNKVSLEDLKGQNVLLLFFPLAFTSVCTAELCSIRDNIAFYNDAHATVLGISVDSLYTLKKFKEEQGLNFTLLSDFNKTASAAYGALYDVFPAFGMEGVSKRAAFVIDRQGTVQYAEICATPGDLPNFNNIQVILSALN